MKLENKEGGITLVALIITIIILVILAAISIAAAYRTKIVGYAINGAQEYAKWVANENKILSETENKIESTINTITDILGGSTPEISKPPEEIIPEGKTEEELGKTENIGKYVDYKPAGSDYIVNGTYSGTGTDQVFSANNDMKWRIWGVEENKLLLISETVAGRIKLQGAEGYNNAVKLLNDACSTAFGNSSYGDAIVARSINQDDIDKVTNMTTEAEREAADSNYNYGVSGASTITPSYNSYYPKIYAQELSKSVGGTLGRSEQSSWYSGNVSGSSTGYCSYYNYSMTNYVTQTIYDALLTNPVASSTTGSESHPQYWIASRCVYINSNSAGFDVFFIYRDRVGGQWLYNSAGQTADSSNAVRPIVEVNLESVAIGVTGEGTDASRYSMVAK